MSSAAFGSGLLGSALAGIFEYFCFLDPSNSASFGTPDANALLPRVRIAKHFAINLRRSEDQLLLTHYTQVPAQGQMSVMIP